MTEKELFKEIGMIKEEYVAEAEDYKRSVIHNVIFKRTLATAACLVLCVGIYWGVRSLNSAESTADADFVGLKADKTVNQQVVYVEQESTALADASVNTEQVNTSNESEEAVECFPKEPASKQHQYEVSENIQMAQSETRMESSSVAEDLAVAGVQSAPTEEFNTEEHKYMDSIIYDFVAIKERLTQYPSTVDELCQEEICMIRYGIIDKGQERWEEFLQSINMAEPADIDIVQFTIEGDPIITCLHFDGQMFRVVCDNTKDSWAGKGAGISERSYKYLNILQNDGLTEVILSQEADLTVEQLRSGEYEIYIVLQYNVE